MHTSADNPQPGASIFPSRILVILCITSCFIATAAFVTSFVQIASSVPHFIVPSTIGFLATIPHYAYFYFTAPKSSSTHSDPVFITHTWLIVSFLLAPLWAVIFYVNILFIVGSGSTPGIILTTIWSGLEWPVLLCTALKCLHEIEHLEPSNLLMTEDQNTDESRTDETLTRLDTIARSIRPRALYFVSAFLCTMTMVFSMDDRKFVWPFNVLAFLLTAPHHFALFISIGWSQHPTPILSRVTNIWYSIFLVALWCCLFFYDIAAPFSAYKYKIFFMGVCGGAECIILVYLAILHVVLDKLQAAEGSIRI